MRCPNCASKDIQIAKDALATRHCSNCHRDWLPKDDPADWQRLSRAQAEVASLRSKFRKISDLCAQSVDTYYTLKLIQKMAEDTNRLAEQTEEL